MNIDVNGIKVSGQIVRKISNKTKKDYYALEVPIDDEYKMSFFVDQKDIALLKAYLKDKKNNE